MKPYVIVAGDFVTTGGMDVANLELARYLALRGHPVHLVAHRVDAALAALPGVSFHRVAKPAGSYFLSEPLLGFAASQHAARAAKDGARVIVNGGNCSWPGAANWVHYVHGAYEPAAAGWRGWIRTATHHAYLRRERKALASARLVIANSERTRRDLVERAGVPASRVRRVYYGSDLERFRPVTEAARLAARDELGWPRTRRVVAFVGGLGDRRKGFDTLFEAWRGLDADLAVAGDGAERKTWEERARAERLAIRFLGRRDDMPRVLAACDALVSPARYEAYGLGVHEAICRGLPAIAPRDAGVAERYPDAMRDLLLADPADAGELAGKLRLLCSRIDHFSHQAGLFAESMLARGWRDMSREIVDLVEASHGA